jgi:hypothetical protein
MGHINTQITLKNFDDAKRAKKGQLPSFAAITSFVFVRTLVFGGTML